MCRPSVPLSTRALRSACFGVMIDINNLTFPTIRRPLLKEAWYVAKELSALHIKAVITVVDIQEFTNALFFFYFLDKHDCKIPVCKFPAKLCLECIPFLSLLHFFCLAMNECTIYQMVVLKTKTRGSKKLRVNWRLFIRILFLVLY